jgi:hypothetical protein
MTDREIFDKVRAHLLNQGVRAMVNDACRYRTPQGMACAVGCLIPEEFYDPMIETGVLPRCADGLWNDKGAVDENDDTLVDVMNQCGIPARNSVRSLLTDLQAVHDGNEPSKWLQLLLTMATHFVGDEYTPPEPSATSPELE